MISTFIVMPAAPTAPRMVISPEGNVITHEEFLASRMS